jgi:radical SAM protein with 4Fe4S-binding SPASM domain
MKAIIPAGESDASAGMAKCMPVNSGAITVSEIWMDTSEELMGRLKNKKEHVKGRCAACSWLDVCGGNFRVRAEAVSGDVWAPDPACYLTDEEIALAHGTTSCD